MPNTMRNGVISVWDDDKPCLFRLTNLLEREDKCNPVSLTAWKDSTPLGVNLKNLKQKHMISIIGWALLTGLHALNIRLHKDEQKGFWYKTSWFFLGWSSLSLLYAIGDLILN